MTSAFSGKYASRDSALFELGIKTGFRISELLSVLVGDVFQNGRMLQSVTVQRSWMKGRKNSRTMPLHHKASEAIQKWILEAGFCRPDMAEQPLFSRQHTVKRLSRAQAWMILKRAAHCAGIDAGRVAAHSMRKTFAVRMWQSDHVKMDMAKMAKLLGHRNFSNTLRYLEFLDDSLKDAVLAG